MRWIIWSLAMVLLSFASCAIDEALPGHSWTVGFLTATVWFGFLHEPFSKWARAKTLSKEAA